MERGVFARGEEGLEPGVGEPRADGFPGRADVRRGEVHRRRRAVEEHVAARPRPPPRRDVEDRARAGTRVAQEREALTGRNRERDAVDDPRATTQGGGAETDRVIHRGAARRGPAEKRSEKRARVREERRAAAAARGGADGSSAVGRPPARGIRERAHALELNRGREGGRARSSRGWEVRRRRPRWPVRDLRPVLVRLRLRLRLRRFPLRPPRRPR